MPSDTRRYRARGLIAPLPVPIPPGIVDLMGWPGPWPITPVLVDTGVLLNSIFRGVRWGEDRRFIAAAASGIVRVYAPHTVSQEVGEKLTPGSSWCEKRHIDDVTPFRERWQQEYLAVIRVVTIAARDVRDPRVAAVAERDPSDEAFAALASLLAPCIALSEDSDITDHALATREWEPLALLAGSAAESAAPLISAMFGGNVTVRISAASVAAIARSRWWPLALAAVAGGLYLLHRRDPITRQRLGQWFEAGMRFIGPVVELLEEARAQGEQAHRQLRAAAIGPPSDPLPALNRLARLVAVTPRSCTGTELTALLRGEGLPTTRDWVLEVLRYYSFFEATTSYRWQLGRRLTMAPASGALAKSSQ